MAERNPNPARLLASVALGLLGAATVASQDIEQHLVEYRAYNASLKSGDSDGAIRHARAAWEAAEQELGDHRLTAILAYNYGHLVVFTDAASADAALQRSGELLEAGLADLPAKHVNLYANYAHFIAGGTTRRAADRLRDTLTAVGLDDPDLLSDIAPMWLRLAAHDAVEERFRKARDSAAMAEAAILKASPDAKRALAEAIVIRGVARLVPFPRKVKDVQAAHNEFVRALALFEPQEDIDSFDPLFAQVLAWDHATDAALQAMGEEDYPDHENTDKADSERQPIFRYLAADPSIACGEIEWESVAPAYPSRALREGYIGAVLIGYRLGEDLRAHDARILAEVPQATFGETSLEALQAWRAKALPPAVDPACLRNLAIAIHFIIEN